MELIIIIIYLDFAHGLCRVCFPLILRAVGAEGKELWGHAWVISGVSLSWN